MSVSLCLPVWGSDEFYFCKCAQYEEVNTWAGPSLRGRRATNTIPTDISVFNQQSYKMVFTFKLNPKDSVNRCLKTTKTKRSIYVIVITRFWTAICVKEWNLAERRRTGKPKRADSGERSVIRCRENKIPQPYAVHRSVVGLFLSRRFRLITIITSRAWAPINHTDFEIM